jgi:rod shape-determining protein MreC
LKKYSKYLFLVLVFSLCFLVFFKKINYLQDFLQNIFFPFQSITDKFKNKFEEFLERQKNLEKLESKVEKLEKKIALYKLKNKIYYNYYLENKRLRRLLSLKENIKFATISGEVISYNPTNWIYSFTVDKGRKDGVKVGLAVISYEGLVGRVYKVGENYSCILTILDRNMNVGACLPEKNIAGILRGYREEYCLLEYLPPGSDIKLGEEVVTSGLGFQVPYGIPIGKVVEVRKKINEPIYVKVKPFSNFNNLKEVLILKND